MHSPSQLNRDCLSCCCRCSAALIAIQHCFDIRYTIRVLATAFLLMGLTSSMIAGWWLVTDDFTYAVFSWSAPAHADESLIPAPYPHRHPDPRVVVHPPSGVISRQGAGAGGYTLHSRPASHAPVPSEFLPPSPLPENASVQTSVGGSEGASVRLSADRSAQVHGSQVHIHNGGGARNSRWSGGGGRRGRRRLGQATFIISPHRPAVCRWRTTTTGRMVTFSLPFHLPHSSCVKRGHSGLPQQRTIYP